jgi:hypothetical protein
MRRPDYRTALVLSAVIAAVTVDSGCVARVRLYDADHHDYHRWDGRENRAYQRYLSEQHLEYRDYAQLHDDQQRAYWEWRHRHPDES